jgi:hypothetical protein
MGSLDDLFEDYSQGPRILPREALIAFFESQEHKPTVKIPVILSFSDEADEEVYIAVSEDIDAADKVLLDLDDSGLGVGMEERVEAAFGDQRICHAWLIGKWGALLEIPGLELPEGTYPFTVHDMEVRNDGPTENADAHILVK